MTSKVLKQDSVEYQETIIKPDNPVYTGKLYQIDCICRASEIELVTSIPSAFPLFNEFAQKGIRVGRCIKCGIMRHMDLPFSNEEQYIDFYRNEYPPVKKTYTVKDYEHDKELAQQRCLTYGIGNLGPMQPKRVLDIGSGSGAFVEECRRWGMIAYGCEISKYSYSKSSEDKYIYRDRFEDVHFPTDHFDLVTCHDIVEHVLNPINFLNEVFRVVKQHGTVIIDMPRFFHISGRHHWKPVEHIWYFTTGEFEKILERIGFTLSGIRNPIESKTVFYVGKPKQERPKILLPPGIGDSFWSIVKLQAFLEREKLPLPDVDIVCNRDREFNGHKRAVPFVEMFPFLNSTGKVHDNNDNDPKLKKIWKEAYGKPERTIFKGIHDCDYFISYNGHLRVGHSLEKIDPNLACNWNPPMFVSLEQRQFQESISEIGKYIVFYFVFQGTYKYWNKEFSVGQVIKAINAIVEHTGCVPVFAGAVWDKERDGFLREVIANVPDSVNLLGQTTLPQLFGLLKDSEAVIGYPSGLTIMAAVFGIRTLIIWNDYYNKDFAWNCAPPSVKNETYFITNTKGLTTGGLAEQAIKIVTGKKIKMPIEKILKSKKKPKVSNGKPTIACVLRSGGAYSVEYVRRLHNTVKRNVSLPYRFVCLSDVSIPADVCESIELKHSWPKWWSKIELFREGLMKSERIIYFDLDTIILDNIDDLLLIDAEKFEFAALRPWNRKNRTNGLFASGIMVWQNGNYSFVYDDFDVSVIASHRSGDQQYISNVLLERGKVWKPLQELFDGIYSYKRHCRTTLPPDARIVCFHGNPRPSEVHTEWMKEHWR